VDEHFSLKKLFFSAVPVRISISSRLVDLPDSVQVRGQPGPCHGLVGVTSPLDNLPTDTSDHPLSTLLMRSVPLPSWA